MLAIEYLKLKIWMRMHYKIIGITFHKKKISSQTEKLTFLKIAAKLATSRSLLWGVDFFVRTFFAGSRQNVKIIGNI